MELVKENKVEIKGKLTKIKHLSRTLSEYIVTVVRPTKEDEIIVSIPIDKVSDDIAIGDDVVAKGYIFSKDILLYLDDKRPTLQHYVSATSLEKATTDEPHYQQVKVSGVVCRKPKYYVSSITGESRCEFILSSKDMGHNGKLRYSYFKVLAWSESARACRYVPIGTELLLDGVLRTRKHNKNLPNGKTQERVSYELSAYVLDMNIPEDKSKENCTDAR